jgi:DNA (cytosine-5)-methyltransferase 1
MKAVELFAGAGGLALGSARAGFKHDTVVEWNRDACATLRHNQELGHALVSGWNILEADVSRFDYAKVKGEVTLVAGGPPCQPFSMGGKHRGHRDKRDLFPEAIRAVRELRPKAVIIENVRGLLREAFSEYLEYIRLQLQYPDFIANPAEDWTAHRTRLERHSTKRTHSSGELTYNVVLQPVNAANFGVPQLRNRIFFVAFRSDVDARWAFPSETHSHRALLRSQWITGDYWTRHKVAKKDRPTPSARVRQQIARGLFSDVDDARLLPWVTVRDALSGLPDPRSNGARNVPNHVFQPGARTYAGHTGSPLDAPAKALKAGVHGVPGGENMLAYPDGSVRYFTVRESARIQTFPDDYVFTGVWSETMRQLGNAVPVSLAEQVASSVLSMLRRRKPA